MNSAWFINGATLIVNNILILYCYHHFQMHSLDGTLTSCYQNQTGLSSWQDPRLISLLSLLCPWQKSFLLLCTKLLECPPLISLCYTFLRHFQSSPQTSSLHQFLIVPTCGQSLHLTSTLFPTFHLALTTSFFYSSWKPLLSSLSYSPFYLPSTFSLSYVTYHA